MKFLTLALAIFLAVGCQAASLQADGPEPLPNYLGHTRAVMKVYMNQIKDSMTTILGKIEDTEMRENSIRQVEELYNKIITLQEQVAPITDSAVATLDESTMELRTSIYNDIESLKKELEPMHAELKTVLDKHIEEYKAMIMPLIDEYFAQEQIAAFKAKLAPIMENLQAKIPTNFDETKSKLVPMVEKIREKIATHMETMKQMVDPYVQEYKEQMKLAISQAKNINVDDVRGKLQPHLENVKNGLENIVNEIKNMMVQ